MPTLQHDCPHCLTKNVGFTGTHQEFNPISPSQHTKRWNVYFQCNNCGGGLIVDAFTMTSENPKSIFGDFKLNTIFHISDILPKSIVPDIPENLPENVRKSFTDAVLILKQAPTPSCSAFRRTLEIALKSLGTEEEKEQNKSLKLYERIEKLAKENKITPALKEWAHKLRLDGNDAIHEETEMTVDDAEQMQLFTKYLLIYLFTLPTQVDIASSRS